MELLLIIFISIGLILTLFSFKNFFKERNKENLKKLIIDLVMFSSLMVFLIILN